MEEAEINEFWQKNPCGASLVEDLVDDRRVSYLEFFHRYDTFRYGKEPHILEQLSREDWNGKRVLEIGLGQGSDGEQIANRGGLYYGIDLTHESSRRVNTRFALKGIGHGRITQASVLSLPFADGIFDVVFSHGVLHHVPEVRRASGEIARVLKPGGVCIAMLYAKRSINYLIAIQLVRRLGLVAAYFTGPGESRIVADHLENARSMGLLEYLRMRNFIHRNTDGPHNPYSKVYSLAEVCTDFAEFDLKEACRCFMHAPPLPVGKLPLAGLLGWHLWVHLTPKKGILKT